MGVVCGRRVAFGVDGRVDFACRGGGVTFAFFADVDSTVVFWPETWEFVPFFLKTNSVGFLGVGFLKGDPEETVYIALKVGGGFTSVVVCRYAIFVVGFCLPGEGTSVVGVWEVSVRFLAAWTVDDPRRFLYACTVRSRFSWCLVACGSLVADRKPSVVDSVAR